VVSRGWGSQETADWRAVAARFQENAANRRRVATHMAMWRDQWCTIEILLCELPLRATEWMLGTHQPRLQGLTFAPVRWLADTLALLHRCCIVIACRFDGTGATIRVGIILAHDLPLYEYSVVDGTELGS
jgi:hypothetical protein